MCGVIMFTATGIGQSKQEAKHAAATTLLGNILVFYAEEVLGFGTNNTVLQK
jgi:hypothetical protein